MNEVLKKVLWSTIEDFVGLWEIAWELNSLLSHNDALKNQKMAKKIVDLFLKRDLVRLYFNKWGSEKLEKISLEDTLNILDQKKYWDAPNLNDLCIKVGSTHKGELVYKSEGFLDVNLNKIL